MQFQFTPPGAAFSTDLYRQASCLVPVSATRRPIQFSLPPPGDPFSYRSHHRPSRSVPVSAAGRPPPLVQFPLPPPGVPVPSGGGWEPRLAGAAQRRALHGQRRRFCGVSRATRPRRMSRTGEQRPDEALVPHSRRIRERQRAPHPSCTGHRGHGTGGSIFQYFFFQYFFNYLKQKFLSKYSIINFENIIINFENSINFQNSISNFRNSIVNFQNSIVNFENSIVNFENSILKFWK